MYERVMAEIVGNAVNQIVIEFCAKKALKFLKPAFVGKCAQLNGRACAGEFVELGRQCLLARTGGLQSNKLGAVTHQNFMSATYDRRLIEVARAFAGGRALLP